MSGLREDRRKRSGRLQHGALSSSNSNTELKYLTKLTLLTVSHKSWMSSRGQSGDRLRRRRRLIGSTILGQSLSEDSWRRLFTRIFFAEFRSR